MSIFRFYKILGGSGSEGFWRRTQRVVLAGGIRQDDGDSPATLLPRPRAIWSQVHHHSGSYPRMGKSQLRTRHIGHIVKDKVENNKGRVGGAKVCNAAAPPASSHSPKILCMWGQQRAVRVEIVICPCKKLAVLLVFLQGQETFLKCAFVIFFN